MKIIEWIKSLFTDRAYQDSVESFVASKQPKSTAEVEYWIQYYNQKSTGWSM